MKLVDKVKNFFYEDVDDDEEYIRPEKIKPDKVKEEKPKKEKKEFFFKKEPKEEVKEDTQVINIDYEDDYEDPNKDLSERELLRAEKTFNFPVEMEEDEDVTSSFTEEEKDEFFGPTSRLKFEDDKVEIEPKKEVKKFRPTPVISPVYGILDKDYNLEDVEEINKGDDHSLNKKINDYDAVRSKAYKQMDDELEKTLNERKSIFYNLEEKEEKEVNISYGEDEQEAKEVEIKEETTRVKKNKKLAEESEEDNDEIKTDTNELFNLLDNVTTEEYDEDDE